MSTEVKNDAAGGANPPAGDDLLKNLKSEFNRKLENTDKLLKDSTAALMARIDAMAKPAAKAPPAAEEDDIETEFYKSPASALKKVKDQAKKELREEFAERDSETQARNSTIAKLYKDYPELNDDESKLTKRALEIQSENIKEYGNTPASYKIAVTEAALELGMKPKKMRANDEDDSFVMGGSGQRGASKGKRDELSAETKAVAELLGVDPEKVKKRQSGRKNFGRWE